MWLPSGSFTPPPRFFAIVVLPVALETLDLLLPTLDGIELRKRERHAVEFIVYTPNVNQGQDWADDRNHGRHEDENRPGIAEHLH